MTARWPSKVTSSNPRRAPRLRISSVKNPLSRAPTSPDATARIAVVLPAPGDPVIRSATAERHRHAPGRDQASARRMSAAGQATARLPASSLTISPTKPLPSPRSIMVSSRIGHSPGRRGPGEELASPALEVGVLHRDLVAPEGEDVAARDLDLLAVGGGSGEEPLGEPTVARDEVSRVAEVHVGEALEHAREALAHSVLPHEALAPRVRPRRELEYAVVRHERHEVVHVVPVPAVAERFQIPDRDHAGALRARHDAAEGPARQATIFRARCIGARADGGRMYRVATSYASGGGRCYFCDTSSRGTRIDNGTLGTTPGHHGSRRFPSSALAFRGRAHADGRTGGEVPVRRPASSSRRDSQGARVTAPLLVQGESRRNQPRRRRPQRRRPYRRQSQGKQPRPGQSQTVAPRGG